LDLDDVLLLAKGGSTAYLGESKKALEYFQSLGFECPPMVNPVIITTIIILILFFFFKTFKFYSLNYSLCFKRRIF